MSASLRCEGELSSKLLSRTVTIAGTMKKPPRGDYAKTGREQNIKEAQG
jgi:hypothetical protein